MKGILNARPGFSLTCLIWPNCSTNAFSRSSTTKIDDSSRNSSTTKAGMINFSLSMRSVSLRVGAVAVGAGHVAAVAAQLVQRKVGHHVAAAFATGDGFVEDGLVDIAKNLFHRFEIETLAGHFGRLAVFGENRCEPARVTFGLVDDAGAIAFGLFEDLRRFTARFGKHAVGIGVRLTLQPV